MTWFQPQTFHCHYWRIINHYRYAVSNDRERRPRNGDEIREGITRVETRALKQQAAEGLISLMEPNAGNRLAHALMKEYAADRQPAEPPD